MGTAWDRRQWRDADSPAAIGELTARWLEGGLAYQPEDFATEPAPETRPPVPVLAPLDRAGYVTTNSQPRGRPAGRVGAAGVRHRLLR